MNKQNNSGFTLIELVVVIAILGILSGIGVAGYSGYIQKANEAADEVLLGAVNSAFQVSVVQANPQLSAKDIPDGNASITPAAKKISGSAISITADANFDAATIEEIQKAFDTYFGENKNTELKYFESIVFSDGVFEGVDPNGSNGVSVTHGVDANGNPTTTYSIGNLTATVKDDDISKLVNSDLGQNMTATELSTNVTNVTDVATGLINGGRGTAYMNNAGFQTFLADVLDIDDVNTLSSDQKANALVLYAANQSKGKSGADYVTAFTTKAATTMQHLVSDDPQYLADAAAGYALMLGFAYSDEAEKYIIGDKSVKEYFQEQSGNLKHASDIVTMLQTIDNASLKDGETPIVEGKTALMGYTSTNGEATLDGYLAALNMVDSNINNFDASAISDLLSSGYGSGDVVSLLQAVMGRN